MLVCLCQTFIISIAICWRKVKLSYTVWIVSRTHFEHLLHKGLHDSDDTFQRVPIFVGLGIHFIPILDSTSKYTYFDPCWFRYMCQVDWPNYTAIKLLRLLDFVLKSWMSTLLVSYLMLHFYAPGWWWGSAKGNSTCAAEQGRFCCYSFLCFVVSFF